MMQRQSFGATGLEVSPLGIGATDRLEVIELMLDSGANLVDTAQVYGEHEVFLGEYLSHRRDQFILVSKCGHHDILPDGTMRSRDISMDDIDRALKRLRTDYLDAMLLHSYDRDRLEAGDAVAVLARARQAGKIRFAGYSGDNDRAAIAAGMEELDILETSISVADQYNIDEALPVARARGMGVIAKRPVANAAWRYLDEPAETYAKHKVAPYVERLKAMDLDLPALGFEDFPAGWGELAVRFNLTVPGLHCSIIATRQTDHARANLAMAAKGPLPRKVYDTVRRAFAEAEKARGERWLGEN